MDVTCTVDGCLKPPRSKGLCDAHYVHQWRYGTTALLEAPRPKPCKRCEQTFQPKYNRTAYCSPECKTSKGACETCGKVFVAKKGATGKYCSRGCWYAVDNSTKLCPVCDSPFRGQSNTCSRDCGYKLRRATHPTRVAACEQCGRALIGKKPQTRFCTRSCSMRARTHARGGPALPDGTRRPASNGYVQVKADGRWVLEHRHAMQQVLGRPLLRHETPHHVNGVRSDNTVTDALVNFRSGNLELWSSSQPPGQRVEDKVEWATELLRQYRPDLLTEHCPGCRCGEMTT